ncbi:uncharacterized protein LOC131162869 [Malania oleifera]|uniref:uncharacterized protein LOC131162869 n=1 Tax=Malania oleifera TaxID=397392 RepID=UPI0025AE864D|nr:uncharacterized protein LOC131162869 [Malania oleifera]
MMVKVVQTNREQDRPAAELVHIRFEAENWIGEIEKILDFLNCTERHKVAFTMFKLSGEVKRWWKSMKMLEEHRPIPVALSWTRFRELFFERYFQTTIRNAKIEEFISLEQGQLTIQQYATSFQELSRFAPFMIPDEAMKAWKFQRGLKKEIHKQTTIWKMPNFLLWLTKPP